jgi:DNA invertase Pin-like site-specific DNA recombinase
MTKTGLPIDIVVRVSSKGDREDERFHSPKEQAKRARELIERAGLVVGETFEDINVSGGVHPEKRRGMMLALQRVRAGVSGGIAAFALDRLTRDPAHGDWLLAELARHDAVVLAPDIPENIATPEGELAFGILLMIARHYRRKSGEHIEGEKKRATLAGVLVGPTPVGYRQVGNTARERNQWNDEERRLVLDETTAPAIRQLFELRARRPQPGYGELAAWLDARGVIPWRVRRKAEEKGREPTHAWTRQGVRQLLNNDFYLGGPLTYGDVVSEHHVPSIIDRELWAASRPDKKAERSQRQPGESSQWLVAGLLRCQGCQLRLTAWTGSNRRKNQRGEWVQIENPSRRYVCKNRSCASRASIDAKLIENIVTGKAFEVSEQLFLQPVSEDTEGVEALETELARLERLLDVLMTQEAQEAWGERWLLAVNERREERDAVAVQLGLKRREFGLSGGGYPTTLGAVWTELTRVQQREALQATFDCVVIGQPVRPGISRGRAGVIPAEYDQDGIVFKVGARWPWKPLEIPIISIVPVGNFPKELTESSA